jgi:hypothetical protein
MTPIRVMVNGSTQSRFSGWVDGSPVTFPSPEGTSSLLTVTVSDSIALMQRHSCGTSVYEETLAAAIQTSTLAGAFVPAGCAYWPLSDGAGSPVAYEATGLSVWGALDAAGASFGRPGINAAQSTSVTSLNGSTSTVGSGSVASGVTAGIWFNGTSVGIGPALMQINFGSGGNLALSTDGNKFVANSNDGAGHIGTAAFNTPKASDGAWHYVQMVMDGSGGVTLYIDGTSVATGAAAGWAPASTAIGSVSISSGGLAGALVSNAWCALGQNTAAATSLYAAATLTLGGLTTTQLLGYLAKWAVPLAPFGANAIDTNNSGTLTPAITFLNNDCLSLSQVAVDTEDGPLFCKRSGPIASFTHRTLATHAASTAAATFVNGDAESDLTFSRDSQFLVTNCQITALSGTGSVVAATKNLVTLGNYPFQKSLYVTDYEASDYASAKTDLYGDINYSRIGQFTIDLLNSVDIQTAALGIDIGSRVTFSGLPTQGGYTTADVIVQGFTENWTINGWSISFNTTPSSSYPATWILGDAVYGLLGSTTVLGY